MYRNKTGTIFSVIKLETSGSFIFPNEISHSEQQRLKTKDYEVKHQNNEVKAKKNIIGFTTVEKFELANSVSICSTFLKSLLGAPWSLTLAGLILAGAKSKPMTTNKSTKKDGPSENEFHGKTV